MYKVYLIKNKINDKVYVGKTKQDIEIYFAWHITSALKNKDKNSKPLYRAIRKYGDKNFVISILFKSNSLSEINKKEIFFIKQYKYKSYNIAKGGDGGDTMSNHPRKKHIYKKREINHPRLPTYGMLNKHHSTLTKMKISKANSGNKNGMYNKQLSKESLLLHSRRMKGKGNPACKRFIVVLPNGKIEHKEYLAKFIKDNNFSLAVFKRYIDTNQKVMFPNSKTTRGRDKVIRMKDYKFYSK